MRDIYIEILRIGSERLDQGEATTYVEIEAKLVKMGFKELQEDTGLQIAVFRWLRKGFTFREYVEDNTNIDFLLDQDGDKVWKERATIPVQLLKKMYIRPEYYMELIHYEALQEARADSKKSIGLATKALWLTFSMALASIIIQIVAILLDR